MQADTYLVVVSIYEGRNFTSQAKSNVVIECKFDGELLSTDPVPCTTGPDFTTELAWEMDRKALHQHRMQRTPVKLQCYVVDQITSARESIGYILLDLRGVQTKPKPPRWYSLLGKASKPKPEVKIAMVLEDDSAPAGDGEQGFKAQDAPPRTIVPISEGIPMEAVLNAEEGYFQVGADNPDCEIFILSTTVGAVHNLDQLVSGGDPLPNVTSGYFFYYTLFGSDITNDPFNDLISPNITPERATVRVRSTIGMLKIYFHQNSVLSVHLCCGDYLLGTASAHFGELFTQPKLEALTREQITVKGDFELTKSNAASQGKVGNPTVHVAISLHREAAMNVENLVVTSSPKKEATKVLEEATAPEDEPVRDGDVMVEVPRPLADTDEDVESIVASGINMEKKPEAASQQAESLTTTATHSNLANNLVHHFRFSVNIRSVCKLDLPRTCNLFVRYSYPFFGSSAPVMTKPIEVKRNSEVILPRSLCVFNFACSSTSLTTTFCSTPLHLEVWHRDKETKDVLLGSADLSLSQVIQTDRERSKTNLNGKMVEVVKQTCSGHLPIHSEKQKVIAEVSVTVTLDDFGPSKDYNVMPPPQPAKPLPPPPPSPAKVEVVKEPLPDPNRNLRETNEYKTAVELELWKSEEQERFQKRMQQAEAEHLQLLSDEFKKRDREREILVAKRVSEYQELEKQLAESITSLEKREKVVSTRESELRRAQQDFDRDVKSHNEEILQRTKQLQTECEGKVKLERDRRALLEEHNRKLSAQVSELERKYESLMTSFYDYKNQVTRPEIRLEAELNLARLEKAELERKLESTSKSKLHYKQQWGRTLKELALMKKREQEHARANLRHQQQELEVLKQQARQMTEASALNDDKNQAAERERIERMESELRLLREQQQVSGSNSVLKTSQHQNTIAILPSAAPIVSSGGDAHNDMINEKVARLIEERDTLLKTGVYTRTDRIITELDRQISECMRSGHV